MHDTGESKRGFAYLSRELMLEIWPLLKDDERALLPVLMTYFPNIKPAVATLAGRLGKSTSSIQRATRSLAKVGLLVAVRSSVGGRFNETNEWRVAAWDDAATRAKLVAALTGRMVDTGGVGATGSMDDTGSMDAGGRVSSVLPHPCHPCHPTPVTDATQKRRREGGEGTGEEKEEIAAAPLSGCAGSPAGDVHPRSGGVAAPGSGGVAAPLPGDGVSLVSSPGAPSGAVAGAAGTTVAAQPRSGSRSRGSSSRAGKSRGAAEGDPAWVPLTDAQKALVLSDLEQMKRYLFYGAAGVGDAEVSGMPPGSFNFRRYGGTKEDPKAELWDTPSFAGFFWFLVSKYRVERQIPMTIPIWGRLMGDVKNLAGTMTKADFYKFLCYVTFYFDVIKFKLGGIGSTLALGDTTLSHSLVRQMATNFMNDRAQLDAACEEFRAWDGRQAA